MKILKYKKLTNGRYKVYFDDMELCLYEEVILKYELLLKKELSIELLEDVSNDNLYYEIYYTAIKSINSRFKSVFKTRMLLINKGYPNDIVASVIDKLIEQGYLNDRSYARSFINNQIIISSNGPNKIRKELLDDKVDSSIIEEELAVFDIDTQLEKINKLANRFYKSNKNKGGFVLKKKIINDLINYGYDISLIESVLNNFDFSNNKDIAKKEYDKLYNKLSKKYSGEELRRKINEKMFMKGLKYEED